MTNTLVIDEDGVYDPRVLNDRLLLGLKGSMAEFELGLMRQRAREALLQMIRRGPGLWDVPGGYLRTEDRSFEIVPGRQGPGTNLNGVPQVPRDGQRPAGPSLVSPGTHSAAAPATWNRRQRNWLASTGLQLHPAPAKESGLCGHVRPRSQWWEDDHTRRPGAEDVWTFSAP